MLINVIVDSDDGHRPVLTEVQIELRSIIEVAMAQHKARTVRRVRSCSSPSRCLSAVWVLCCSRATVLRNSPRENSGREISGARHGHGDATAQEELSTVEANPTSRYRSKAHPADKYAEVSTAPLVDMTRPPSAMVVPEPDDVVEKL